MCCFAVPLSLWAVLLLPLSFSSIYITFVYSKSPLVLYFLLHGILSIHIFCTLCMSLSPLLYTIPALISISLLGCLLHNALVLFFVGQPLNSFLILLAVLFAVEPHTLPFPPLLSSTSFLFSALLP